MSNLKQTAPDGYKPELNTRPFKREDRYIVIKRSDLALLSPNDRDLVLTDLESIYSLMSAWDCPARKLLVIESDWPEFEPTWAAIETRVTGKPAEQHLGEPVAWLYKGTTTGDMLSLSRKEDHFEHKYGEYGEHVKGEPLYTHADPCVVERLASANTEFARRHLEGLAEVERLRETIEQLGRERRAALRGVERLEKERDTLRAHLADLKRRYDGLHHDMATIAGRETPKGCTVADYAAAAIADALSASAEPSAPVERDERAEFEACIRREWPMAPISRKRDLLPKDDPCYDDYCDEPLQRAWVGWQMRAAQERKP